MMPWERSVSSRRTMRMTSMPARRSWLSLRLSRSKR
jgi:hypothetical protein